MSVYFVYRSHYDNPGAFYLKKFPADNVLEWFQSIWKPIPNEEPDYKAHDHAKKLIGRSVYSFGSLFGKIHEENWPPPKSMKALVGHLEEALYVNEMKSGPNHIQVLTDDDELEMAIYIFDDHYAAKHPEQCAFLMREDWVLPDGLATGKFKPPAGVSKQEPIVAGEGCTYLTCFVAYDGGELTDLSPGERCYRIPNVRVPDLPRYLFTLEPTYQNEEPPVELPTGIHDIMSGLAPAVQAAKGREVAFLKAVAADPNDTACWAAYSDWLTENDTPTLIERILKRFDPHSGSIRDTRNLKKDRAVVQMHVGQASKHVARWELPRVSYDLYHHFVFFDDLWANAHPHLAASLLRTANRWDPL